MQRAPRHPNAPILSRRLIGRILLASVLILLGAFGIFHWETTQGSTLEVARTAAVNIIVLIQLFYLLNCRSLTRTIFSIGFLSNRWLLAGIGLMLTMQLLFTYAPPLQSIFRTSGIGLLQWGVALAAGLVAFLVVEAEKHLGKAGEKP